MKRPPSLWPPAQLSGPCLPNPSFCPLVLESCGQQLVLKARFAARPWGHMMITPQLDLTMTQALVLISISYALQSCPVKVFKAGCQVLANFGPSGC